MFEIRMIHEWRPGHADPLALFDKGMKLMDDIATRIETSVSALAAAIDNQNVAIAEVATAIRNHPGSTTDNGRLSALADRLDGITSALDTTTASLHGLAGEEDAEDAGGSVPPVTPAPVDTTLDTLSQSDVGSVSDVLGAGNAGEASTGEQFGDVSGSDVSSGTTSGDAVAEDQGASAAPVGGEDGSAQPDTASGDGFAHDENQ